MKKLLSVLLLSTTVSFAGLIDAIALVVNNEPITLYDIDKKINETNMDKKQAVSSLIDEILYKQLLKKENISIDIFDINDYLEKVAASNGMDLYTFKSVIRQKYKDYDTYEKEIRKRLEREKLINKLVQDNLKVATNEDLKIYYDNNKNQFTMAKQTYVTQYISKDKKALLFKIKNPISVNETVLQSNLILEQKNLNPQIRYLLNGTAINHFTPIFVSNGNYITFLVTKKKGVETIAFDNVKNKIFEIIMKKREQNFLKEYFEKLKLTANIKVIR